MYKHYKTVEFLKYAWQIDNAEMLLDLCWYDIVTWIEGMKAHFCWQHWHYSQYKEQQFVIVVGMMVGSDR